MAFDKIAEIVSVAAYTVVAVTLAGIALAHLLVLGAAMAP
jgi:hypothetical protein